MRNISHDQYFSRSICLTINISHDQYFSRSIFLTIHALPGQSNLSRYLTPCPILMFPLFLSLCLSPVLDTRLFFCPDITVTRRDRILVSSSRSVFFFIFRLFLSLSNTCAPPKVRLTATFSHFPGTSTIFFQDWHGVGRTWSHNHA